VGIFINEGARVTLRTVDITVQSGVGLKAVNGTNAILASDMTFARNANDVWLFENSTLYHSPSAPELSTSEFQQGNIKPLAAAPAGTFLQQDDEMFLAMQLARLFTGRGRSVE
jgi:hypothetical protein